MTTYLLAHDLGTSGNKATLFTSEGTLVKSCVHSYPTDYFNNNWAEQDADHWWRAICDSTREILTGIDAESVAVVSFSGQMMGCLCVDREGKPLRKSIIWADMRAERQANQIREGMDEQDFYRITGHKISPSYSIEKLMWIRDNEPEIYARTYKMLQAKEYILFKLTGAFVTEYTDACGTNVFDLNTLDWSEKLISLTGIDGDKLPDAHPSTHIAGDVHAVAAEATGLVKGTPVVCGGGDGICAAVGAGCIKPGTAFNYIGSSSWISSTTEAPIYDDGLRTFNWPHIVPGYYSPCGAMQSAGGSFSWLKNEIAKFETVEGEKQDVSPFELINEVITQSPAGANGLIYLPYLLGERSPRWNPNARGAFIGIKMEHQRADVFRSVLEGVTFNLGLILDIFKQHVEIPEMVLIGGGAQGALWRQIMADIYELPVLKPNYLEEATSMGAAITGGVGVGVFPNFDVVDRFIEIETRQTPIEENSAVYAKIKPIFDASYHALVGVYEQMAKV